MLTSSQRLLNALSTGLAAAESANRVLDEENASQAAAEYQALIGGIENAFLAHREWWYCLENRSSGEPFWTRRLSKVLE
jgi:hypothetical protein